jgi:hypothetical protein
METMLSVKNYLEYGVRAEVGRHKAAAERSSSDCWCSVCEADVNALSLTTLPPCYSMERTYAVAGEKIHRHRVESAVRQAVTRVRARPKHRPGVPSFYPHQIRVINFAMEEGATLVRSVMETGGSPCVCFQCQADTLAFALNRFPPLYGVECDGAVNFPPTKRDFFRHDLIMVLEQAAKTVALHPHH